MSLSPPTSLSTQSELNYQEQALKEFTSHLTSLTTQTSTPTWSTNPSTLHSLKPIIQDLLSTFNELFWFHRLSEVQQEIKLYLPHLDSFTHNQPFKPSLIVNNLFNPQDWHDLHDFDLIFHAWDDLLPLLRKTEKRWLKYIPRNGSVIISNPITGRTYSNPNGLAVAMQSGTWLDYKGDLYKAEWSHFHDDDAESDDARKNCQKALGILNAVERAARKEDSKRIVELLFGAEKKLLVESEAFIRDEEGESPWSFGS
jgi:hypothetical protein